MLRSNVKLAGVLGGFLLKNMASITGEIGGGQQTGGKSSTYASTQKSTVCPSCTCRALTDTCRLIFQGSNDERGKQGNSAFKQSSSFTETGRNGEELIMLAFYAY